MERERLLTTGQVAEYCQVTPHAVAKWIESGKLAAYTTPGGHRRIPVGAFRTFLERYDLPIYDDFFTDGQRRVLVVDDDPATVDFVVSALSEDGNDYRLDTAADGYEAGLKVASFRPCLVILDAMMPGLDGPEVCRRIKADPQTKQVKVLAITGYAREGLAEDMLARGADGVLLKPLDVDELRRQVQTLLGG